MILPENIAYSPQYRQMRMDAMGILDEENFDEENTFVLSNGDTAIFRVFEKTIGNCQYSGSRFLLYRNGKAVYTLDMPIDSGSLICQDVIEHGNGRQYLLFRTELYGYSVLDLQSLKAQHYIPEGRIDGRESFIWCNAIYCAENDLLAVTGCYWACPESTLAVDFSHPEVMPFHEFDLMNDVDNFENDTDPVRWENDGSLTYKIGNQTYTVSKHELRKRLPLL